MIVHFIEIIIKQDFLLPFLYHDNILTMCILLHYTVIFPRYCFYVAYYITVRSTNTLNIYCAGHVSGI
jgi:hypothetical protein